MGGILARGATWPEGEHGIESLIERRMPVDERTPGGLGLYLLQNIVDELEYDYRDRRSRIRFVKDSGQKNV